jgi:peptidoglycan hydrolase CwlO-like protein
MESKEKNEKNEATLQHQEKEGDIYIFELEMEDEKTEQEKTADEKTEQEKTADEKTKQEKTEEEKTKQEKTEDEKQMDQPRGKQKRKNPHTPGSGCFCLRCRFFKIKNV